MNLDYLPPYDVFSSVLAAWVGGLLMKDDIAALVTALYRKVRPDRERRARDLAERVVARLDEVRHG